MPGSLSLRSTGQSTERNDPYLRIHAITIFVRDQERSVRFYVDKLGFNVAFDASFPSGDRWVAVGPQDGETVLSLVAPKPGSDNYKLIGQSTQVVLVTEDVALKYREWRERGVRFRHTPRLKRVKFGERTSIWGGVFTRFEDLDGNCFSLVSFDEVSRAVEAQRKAAAERLEVEHRATQELQIAKEVQARLFPQRQPPLRTLEYAGVCIQARQVGGDYYDFLELGQERLGLVIGDIAGKGIAAALLMANLQANLRSQCANASDNPQRFLRSLNQLFFENTIDTAYATLIFAEYDDGSQRLRYVNCGHLSALLLRRDNTLERLGSTSTVLGLFKDWDCSMGECRLDSGDVLALYTDGVTESFNTEDEEFGEQRLVDTLRRDRDLPSQALLGSIVKEVQQFSPNEQSDDLTLIVAKCACD